MAYPGTHVAAATKFNAYQFTRLTYGWGDRV